MSDKTTAGAMSEAAAATSEATGHAAVSLVRWRPTRLEMFVSLGLGLYMAWVGCTFFGYSPISGEAANTGDGYVVNGLYVLSALALCATLVLCAVFHQRVDRVIYTRRALVAAPMLMAASTLALIVRNYIGIVAPCEVALGVATGVTSAVFLLQWGNLASTLGMRENVITGCLGYLVSIVIEAFYELLVGLIVNLASPAIAPLFTVFDACLPLAAGAILLRTLDAENLSLELPAGIEAAATTDQKTTASSKTARRIIGRVVVATVLFQFVIFFCRELSLFLLDPEQLYSPAWKLAVRLGTIVVTAAMMMLLINSFLSQRQRSAMGVYYRAAVLMLIIATMLIPASTLISLDSELVSSMLSGSLTSCVGSLMWITTAGICNKYRANVTQYFAAIRVAWAVGPLLGLLVVNGIVTGGMQPSAIYLAVMACVTIAFVTYAFVFTERIMSGALAIIPKQRRQPFHERCAQVARNHGLTERELEIMVLFAKGRDSAYIQEHLYLSKSTVSTHRQHIYGKLDVHSHQEMLDLIHRETEQR